MGMSVPERRVIVVGGGAAGMMASIFAGKAGARVTLLERRRKAGQEGLHHRERALQRHQ